MLELTFHATSTQAPKQHTPNRVAIAETGDCDKNGDDARNAHAGFEYVCHGDCVN